MRQASLVAVLLVVGMVVVPAAEVLGIELVNVTFPERKNVRLDFTPTSKAPRATLEAVVESQEGLATVKIDFDGLKPAVLFGGDVSCYVVWAVALDGTAENLGELWGEDLKGKVELVSIQKSFALMVTAEPFYLVDRPSSLVMFTSGAHKSKRVPSVAFPFTAFAPAPEVDLESIANVAWDSETPPLVLQAEKAFELAQRNGAGGYVPNILYQAEVALGQAKAFARSGSGKNLADYSRRSVARSSEALQMTVRRKQAEELERQIAQRKAEMEELAGRVTEAEAAKVAAEAAKVAAEAARVEAMAGQQEAEAQRLAAEASVLQAQAELGALELETTRLTEEGARLTAERDALQVSLAAMEAGLAEVRAETARLETERDEMAGRLDEALSHVAETRSSARGVIVNLPDILFDVDQSTLKPEARLVLAKLSGILLILGELNLRVEGHTDSTGSAEHNQGLSERRALSVVSFLAEQGIDAARMKSVGYGLARPIADNGTAEGRRRNRRVEIVIAEGEIGEEPVAAAP